MTHDEFIDSLGGTSTVAEATGQALRTVSNWRSRGIAWHCRPKLALLARQKGVAVPEGFLEPARASR